MARQARIVVEGMPHHVMQRGNYGQEVFFDDEDYEIYLQWVEEYSDKYCLKVLGYCLLPNHVHFIVIPEKKLAMSRVFNIVNMKYAQHINKKMQERGHLWQGRYYSCVMDETYLGVALKYIEENPVRLGLVDDPWDWRFSSCSAHVGRVKSEISILSTDETVQLGEPAWMRYLTRPARTSLAEKVVKHTVLGRPLGSDKFIESLEKKLKKKLKVAPRGRPKKV